MIRLLSRGRLAVELSKLKVFENADINSEQYPTDSEIAADVLWDASYKNDIEGKTIADLGCGTGILGIGALLLGAKLVYFIDKDQSALDIAKENFKGIGADASEESKAVFICKDIKDFSEKADIVLQNPPFGTKTRHADRDFLLKAFDAARIVYSFHKTSTKGFIEKISQDANFKITQVYDFEFPIKMSQLFHKKHIHRIKVSCWRMEKVDLMNVKV